jgi:hypothetical protein
MNDSLEVDVLYPALYGALSVKADLISFSTFLALPTGGSSPKLHLCIHGVDGPSCLAALSGQAPKPEGLRRLRREGIDGESASRATINSP